MCSERPILNAHKGMKYLTKLCLGLSHFREHKFKQSTLNAFCSCSLDVETNTHVFTLLLLF